MPNIAIIGGGIGGLTAALALRQFGFEPEVFEQAPALLDVGAAIAVWPNAMRILEQLGLSEKIMQQAGVIKQVRWLDCHGKMLNQVAIGRHPDDGRRSDSQRRSEALAVALHRADLQSTLLHAVPSTSIHLGKIFLSQHQGPDKVSALFADGDSIDCNLLIGADGLHSHMRSQIVGDGPPVYRRYSVWRGIASTFPNLLEPGTAMEFHGRGKRFGIGPVGPGRTGWWAAVNRARSSDGMVERAGDVEIRTHDERSSESPPRSTQHELLNLFDGWYRPVPELIEATSSKSILRTQAFDRPANRTWGTGRVTLLGDAIHPTTPNLGQGGCMAIEDALVIARCIHKYGVTEQALRTYERVRYLRTAAVTRYSRRYGAIGQWENIVATGLRGQMLSLLPETLLRRLMRIVFDYDANEVRIEG
jgi:2-polyprenyl-6-methoxyphenol hydroxylase-like FAD-dependent oxidoreductase